MSEGNVYGLYKSKTAVKFHDKHPPWSENIFTDVILI